MAWFRFHIRDLLWAMVVVGLMIGWWVERTENRRLRSVNRIFADMISMYIEANGNIYDRHFTVPTE